VSRIGRGSTREAENVDVITKVTVQGFKRFKNSTEFEFADNGVTFLAGGNNSGKSTLLQAMDVWEFARSVIEVNRGKRAFLENARVKDVGVGTKEFSPISLPSLRHLWADLHVRRSFALTIGCQWRPREGSQPQKNLTFGFALVNDRLSFKPVGSNLSTGDAVPRLAYLPPFAGIGAREPRLPVAARKPYIGRGLAGAVLRNLLYDLWDRNQIERKGIKGPKGKIPTKALADLRKEDGWERLLDVLEEVFRIGLTVTRFNARQHRGLDVGSWDGHLIRKQFKRRPSAPVKDVMVEGSGFLQWLSVYALAVDRDLDVLLLDEPDAHLHPTLQGFLIHKLGQLAKERNKQVLLATHSTTILAEADLGRIFRMEDRAYLVDEAGRVRLFEGLGSAYAPRLDRLKKSKRLFLHDGPSDIDVLQAFSRVLGRPWPEQLVCWKYTKDRDAREILFAEFKKEIGGLTALSLQDRDDYNFGSTKADLTFDDLAPWRNGLGLRRWRRRNLENYLLQPSAIARAAGKSEQEVRDLLKDHGLEVPATFTKTDCPQTLANTDGKEIFTKNVRSVAKVFGVRPEVVAAAMTPDEVPDDVKTLIDQIVEMAK
jgi:energy-coupling factor transporter ATP-binding protein EcfA2